MKKIKDKKCLYCPCKNVWMVEKDANYTTYECGACYQRWMESHAPTESITDFIEKRGIKKHAR